MSLHKKKIETFTINFITDESYTFEDLITHNEVVGKAFRVKRKDVSLRILSKGKDKDIIVGLVETSRNENIPPKKHRKKKTISKLGLDLDEGLAYANVFLYEKKRQILMYEVNKFGCYVDHFIDYIYRCTKKSRKFTAYNITLNSVLNANEYQRMIKMRFHKSLEIQVANPKQILDGYQHENDALWKVCSSASTVGSTKVSTKFEVSAKGETTGLTSRSVQTIVDRALEIARGPKSANIKKIIVIGYESDSEDNKLQPIDLIADRFLKFIELDEPRENIDLLENQRSKEIKDLYSECADELDTIFSK